MSFTFVRSKNCYLCKTSDHLNVVQTGILGFWQVKDKALIEDRIQCSLLYVCLLLCDSLLVEQQIDLHIGICKKEKSTCWDNNCLSMSQVLVHLQL